MNKVFAFVLLATFFVVAFAAENDKTLGMDALNSGHYAEAYRLWLPLAEQGDRELQEGVALLLLGDEDVGMRFTRSERDRLTLKWLVKSARNG
jgi:hypothetical protein